MPQNYGFLNVNGFIVYFSVPPSVRAVPSSGQITARKGGAVTLECKASGNPVPSIFWTKKVCTKLFDITIYFHNKIFSRSRVAPENHWHALAKALYWHLKGLKDFNQASINAQLRIMLGNQWLLICDSMFYVGWK